MSLKDAYTWRVITLFFRSLRFSFAAVYLKFVFRFLSFLLFLNCSSLYETSPAPSTSFWSSVPVPSLSVASSPCRAASQPAAPSVTLSPHGAASGAAAGSQPSSPRYRPYTVAHPWGPSASAPRSPGISTLSSSPGRPALASSPQAVPASSPSQRPSSLGPPLLAASPSATSRRPSSLRTSPRYLFIQQESWVRVCSAGRGD